MADKMEGGCLCGAVRYETDDAPLLVRTCWCRVCQFFAAGNATINVVFPKAGFRVTGQLRDFPSQADSGRHMHRRFCPTCGVQVTSEAEERPHLVIVRAGTLDRPERAVPEGTIWTASAPAWAHIDPDLPHFAGQPPATDTRINLPPGPAPST